ncbi:MAG: hypothetical protein K6B67_00920 [Lachnospiraceae bacterium]|nr:hypothetical protein [Lachnospiraceae bacterium]
MLSDVRTICMVFVTMFLVPAIIGYTFREKTIFKSNGTILSDIVMGTCIIWAVYLLSCIPLILLKAPLALQNTLMVTFCVIISVIGIYRYKVNIITDWIADLKAFFHEIDVLTIIIIIGLIVIMLGQFVLQSPNDDDYEFVTMSVSAVQTDSLMRYDPVTALEVTSFSIKRLVAPFPMIMATYSVFAGVHPAVFAHSIFPVCIIPICFMVYTLLGQTLFKEKDSKKKIELFLFFILVILLFGGYSTRSLGSMLLLRSWQGKAMVLSFILPLIWKYMLEIMDGGLTRELKFTILITVLGGALTTAMVDIIIPIFVFGYAVSYWLKEKDIKKGISVFITCWPAVVLFGIYIVAELLQRL